MYSETYILEKKKNLTLQCQSTFVFQIPTVTTELSETPREQVHTTWLKCDNCNIVCNWNGDLDEVEKWICLLKSLKPSETCFKTQEMRKQFHVKPRQTE